MNYPLASPIVSPLSDTIVIAIPKGRLSQQIFHHFETVANIRFSYTKRTLMVEHPSLKITILLVKNSDLPEYVNAGVAHMGIAGSDIVYEHDYPFLILGNFPFGNTDICLITTQNHVPIDSLAHTKVATKYTRFAQSFLSSRGIRAHIISLRGSVELAPLLGLAPYIIDLVVTGTTIRENNLVIAEKIGSTSVQCIANKALYALNHQAIDRLTRLLHI